MTSEITRISAGDLVRLITRADSDDVLRLSMELKDRPWTVDAMEVTAALPNHVTLRSSGTTGVPRSLTWPLGALHRDSDTIAAELCPPRGATVISYAPPMHTFGLSCGLLLASRLCGRFVYSPATTPPSALFRNAEEIGLMVTIPSTWTVLARDTAFLGHAHGVRILHSAGPIPERGLLLLRQLGITDVLEVLGSSETGAIATRCGAFSGRTAWKLTPRQPDLDATTDRLSALRCAGETGTPVETGDIIRMIDTRRFEFLGRGNSLLKINGVNVHLEKIEAYTAKLHPDLDVATSIHTDEVRGQSYSMVIAQPLLQPGTEQDLRRTVINEIRARFGGDALPQKLIVRASLRRLHSGKLSA